MLGLGFPAGVAAIGIQFFTVGVGARAVVVEMWHCICALGRAEGSGLGEVFVGDTAD